MTQTTLFSYFTCNEQLKQSKHKPASSYKQTHLTHYFKTIPKKKNLILDYFKPKEKKRVFDLVLIDIKETNNKKYIKCIKKNMYDEHLKYIAISYRWGEEDEQYVETRDYIARITSFYLGSLINLCLLIKNEPDLKEIPYLWIDTISMDQQNKEGKKETILNMNQIFERATFILAIPDLHKEYLRNNSANEEMIDLIYKYKDILHENIKKSTFYPNLTEYNNHHFYYHPLNVVEIAKEKEDITVNKDELKKAYHFLAYLIDDWSNRAWVISEYLIAKHKYEKDRTPLKYIFLSLIEKNGKLDHKSFFSYYFVVDQPNNYSNNSNKNKDSNASNNTIIDYKKVDDSKTLIQFLKSRLIQRSYVNMLVGSNASRSEDRFHAILSAWDKHKYLIKNKNTISEWKIKNMLTVKLKLYDILDDDDLWDKARLLRTCSIYNGKPILPSFATHHQPYFIISEKDNINHAQKMALDSLSKYNDFTEHVKYHRQKESGSFFKQNLLDIQFCHLHQHQYYLSIKAKQYFIFNHSSSLPIFDKDELSSYSLKGNGDDFKLIYIPYFTYTLPDDIHPFPLDENSIPLLSGILLFGNTERWIQIELCNCKIYGKPSLHYANDCIFDIY
ncbi:unnamed protein product [Cunninghamella blakesleeana]